MANLVQELNSLDFSVYIGGPLQAAVNAQHAASMSQVNFIKEVGFVTTTTSGVTTTDLRYVDFKYKKMTPNASTGVLELTDVTIQVPFLTMLTIPAIRIEEINIDFNAKLTSVETSAASSEFAGSAELSAKFWKVKFKASASYKRTTSSSTNVEKTYNLGVRVRAVNDELPAGLDRILTMLEDSIRSA